MSKTIWRIASSDADILKGCDNETQNRFTLTGVVVALIFVLCFISAYRAFLLLLNGSMIAIPLSLFFAWMIFNIYRLLLVTLAKNLLPHKDDKNSPIISLVLRMLFIVLLAIVVAKPLETIVFSNQLNQEISAYKDELRTNFAIQLDEFYLKRIEDAQFVDESEFIKIKYEKTKALGWYSSLLEHSDFLIYRIRILTTHLFFSWVITALIILLFITPAWLKYRIGETSTYYKRKGIIEKELVLAEYNQFKEHYSAILKNVTGKEIQFAESHIDPPFNTKKKTDDRHILKKEELIKWIKAQKKKKK